MWTGTDHVVADFKAVPEDEPVDVERHVERRLRARAPHQLATNKRHVTLVTTHHVFEPNFDKAFKQYSGFNILLYVRSLFKITGNILHYSGGLKLRTCTYS